MYENIRAVLIGINTLSAPVAQALGGCLSLSTAYVILETEIETNKNVYAWNKLHGC